MRFYKFKPIYQERVWGGRGLSEKLGRSLPEGGPIGESWEIVDRPEAQSIVDGGPADGKTIRALIETDAMNVMGPNWEAQTHFPILVKWLDCQERLSLQVHPPANIAPELGGEPKTENWYVAECEADAALLVGLKDGVTRDEFDSALRNNELEPLVQSIPTQKGLSMFVPSGRIHAIDGGNLILEIQQNSDTTYRVYDWGRIGLDGKPRQIHVEESLKSIDFNDFEPKPILPEPGAQNLVESPVFNLEKRDIAAGESLSFNGGEEPRLVGVVSGRLIDSADGAAIEKADNVLLPYASDFSFTAESDTVVVITSGFGG
ncbi:type I phosphomannose isomerase catalytic subunit [Rubellicoccus peritrichatus]|uniref:Type I phosphomannose isomerase catalytic subunit n=1 Tax=Rubellicoccus peritrichatus TaxID=3080537 RepID=A0AAQ3L9S0_9BACT|nr:type I phosphomannose isomerase catalytic subunit [Puniceicoccus sp. CR14]WOO41456.1 type I phosphomannose isomerase catalytic subunit [Puniceicoccus sp. CR14]